MIHTCLVDGEDGRVLYDPQFEPLSVDNVGHPHNAVSVTDLYEFLVSEAFQ